MTVDRRFTNALPSASLAPGETCDFVSLNLIGKAPAFLEALRCIRKLSMCDAPVLIHGETGTGKELAARAIHYLGSRRAAPFIPVNCGAIPDNLVESEFFGHTRGAFTDAKETRAGVIEQAEGGTLYLDELEALTPRGQVALLRFLQDHSYRPVGATLGRTANLRVIGSTNADLTEMARRGVYRADLLFRLTVLPLNLPPLRERHGDAAVLADKFVRRFAAEYQLEAKSLDAAAEQYLHTHDWPGNVRELENLVLRAVLLSDGPSLSFPSGPVASPEAEVVDEPFHRAKARVIADFERSYVTELLRRAGGNLSLAARLCGKERSRLGKLVKKYGLERAAFAPHP
jgi:DNA-binding NtrC family response regulator